MQYPVQGNSTAGKISIGGVRLCQTLETRWNVIETSAGVYSPLALAALDSMITFHRQNGTTVNFGLYGTPLFYASGAANPTYGDNITRDPWNVMGAAANPTSLAAVTNFTSMLVSRYNAPGGAWFDVYGATLGKGIQYWETWNEPSMGAASNGNSTGSGFKSTSFFWGSPAQLVDLAQTQYAAIEAIDPSIVVTTPGFSMFSAAAANTFMTTAGSSTGMTGAQSCDAFSWHPYRQNPPGVVFSNWNENQITGSASAKVVRDWLNANGFSSMKMIASEWGIDANAATDAQRLWYASSGKFRYNWIMRSFMTLAAQGTASVHPWHWGTTSTEYGTSGNWQLDTLGAQKAYNDFAAKAVGKTIVSGTYKYGGEVSLTFSDGTSLTA